METSKGVEVSHYSLVGLAKLAPYLAFAVIGENGTTVSPVLFYRGRGFFV